MTAGKLETDSARRARHALWERQDWQLRASDPPRLADERRLIRVFPDWGTDELPLFESFTEHYRVERDTFPISTPLLNELAAWNAEYLRWSGLGEVEEIEALKPRKRRRKLPPVEKPDVDGWIAEGLALVARLRTELYDVAEIRAEFLYD